VFFARWPKSISIKLKVPYKKVNVEEDKDAMHYIVNKSGNAGVPQIQIGDELILGFDRPKIDEALRKENIVK